ncbi:MAG: Crp/Fnr family transcriptional regulator [Sphingomonadales bacterium]
MLNRDHRLPPLSAPTPRMPSSAIKLDGGDDMPFLQRLQGRAQAVAAGTEIILDDDLGGQIHWVLQGWVAVQKMLPDGRRQILDVFIGPDLIDQGACAAQGADQGITVLTDAWIAPCGKAALARDRRGQQTLDDVLTRLEAAAQARQAERMLRLGQATAYERIAHLLLEFHIRLNALGQARDGVFELPIVQQHLADMAGLTAVHVCRTLRRLVRDGVIDTHDRQIRVNNPQHLADICGIDVASFSQAIAPAKLMLVRYGRSKA